MTAQHAKTHKVLAVSASVVVFLFLFSPLLTFAAPDPGGTGLIPCKGPDCDYKALVQLGKNIMDFLIRVIAIPIATILFVWAGFLYVSVGAKPGNKEKAKGIFMNVFLGLVLILGAWLIVNFLATQLLEHPEQFI